MASLGFSMHSIISSADSDGFTSFPIWVPFSCFSSQIIMAGTAKSVLNSSGYSGRPSLVYGLKGSAFSSLK